MNPISSRQATGVLLVVLSGWSLTMTAQDGQDGWIVLLLAGLCSLPVAALCCLASERMPQGDWFQLLRAAFGTVGGALYVWTLAALAFWSLCMTVLSGVIFADGIRRDLAGVAADGGTARVRGGFGTAWRAAACALGAADGVAGRAGSAVVTGAELETIGLL